jgi:hypothetical protein
MIARKRAALVGALGIAGISLLSEPVQADTRNFTKIADQTTAIPGGTGSFTSFDQPQVSFGNIVFTGAGTNNQRGIYRFNRSGNVLTTIVDASTPLPPPPSTPAITPVLLGPTNSGLSVYRNDVSFMASLGGGGELVRPPPLRQ